MPKQFDFNGGPDKIFVDATNTAIAPGMLITTFHSGDEQHVFVFQIDHAKQLTRILQQNIEVYEKQYGKVDGRLPTEPMETPFKYPEGDAPEQK